MSSFMMLVIALLTSVVSAMDKHAAKTVHKGKDSVISKVIEMLDKEKGKISADIEAEGKEMTEYFGYCDDVQKETAYYIKEATRKIDDATAKIEDCTAQIASLDEEIEELASEMAERSEEMDKEVLIRKKSHEEFLQREKEQIVMVDELTQMEAALKEQMAAMTTPPPVAEEAEAGLVQEPTDEDTDVASPAEGYQVLVQTNRHRGNAKGRRPIPKMTQDMLKVADLSSLQKAMAKVVNSLGKDPETQKNVNIVSGFIQQAQKEPETVEVSAEAMAGQQENTENNMNAFEGLKKKAEEALQKERDSENQKQHDHEMTMISLKEEQKLSQDKTDDCKRDRARLAEEKGEAESVKATNEESKAEDEKNLKALTTECDNAASAWETRQAEATEEQAAIEKAKEILASRVKVFIQKVTHDTPEHTMEGQKIRQTLINHFRGMGQKLGSLSMLNLVSVASTQPLDKIKGLIKGMIEKLTKEAAEAASIHEFCNAEKKKNEDATKSATDKIDDLQSKIDKASAKKDQLGDTIAELTEEIAELASSTEEAIKLRQEQHDTFVKAEKDFSEAADAVQDAMDVLKDYYDNAFLLQKSTDRTVNKGGNKAPPKLGGAKQDSAGGILSILDTMAGEFTKTVAELQSTEKEQVKAFKELKKRNFDSKTAKETAVIKAENEIGSLDITLGHATEDKKLVVKELKAVEEYVLKLKPTCEGRPMSYAERKAKRDAEIEGLKEALAVLEENTPPALLQKTHLRH